jgi:hypothetical protein
MTTFKSLLLISALSFVLGLTSCKKNDPEPEFSEAIQTIVSESVISELRSKGMRLNSGKTPPNVEGIFVVNPLTLSAPYGPEDGWEVGQVISDMTYRFYNQTADQKVTYDYKAAGGNTTGLGHGALIAGNGTEFTIFSEESTVRTSGTASTSVAIISGEMTPQGIKNLQYAFVLTSKTGDDDNRELIPVNKSRIWYDGNQLADKGATFRLSSESNQNLQSGKCPLSIK